MTLAPNLHSSWLFIASFIAGALNAMAGGGSFLSFPALLGVGVLPIQANATNTVALWPGQFTSIAAYREELRGNGRLILPLGGAALTGGFLGALVLLRTGQATFLHLVPWLLLVAALLFAASGPVSRWLRSRQLHPHKTKTSLPLLVVAMSVVCFYIGYFGAGSGFLIISVLALFGIEEMNQINALKVVSTTLANGIAVVTFIVRGQILWRYCLLMMLTAAVGGYVGARWSRRLNGGVLRSLIVLLGLGMAAYFFWRQR
ncbi:MAG TPA: sulfite exporter TauE/SafE family protein [Acidisarcina sp.]|nr:sulfite exporter TauE/SafE family protein [Acidisarcina sp.]